MKTYRDYKIGEKIICLTLQSERLPEDMLEQHLTIGKSYIIEDLDFHFPDSIVVKSDNGLISRFFPIECFNNEKSYKKELRLNKIKTII